MKKFSELQYKRIDKNEILDRINAFETMLLAARDGKAMSNVLRAYYAYMEEYEYMYALSDIRFLQNTADRFYADEKKYWNEAEPEISERSVAFGNKLLEKDTRAKLEPHLPEILFRNLEISAKAISPAILNEMKQENELVRRYSELVSRLTVNFNGEELPINKLRKYFSDKDRNIRKKSHEAYDQMLQTHAAELDGMFDELVRVRDAQAKKLGFKNFTQLGYLRMTRNCYGEKQVKAFRDSVLKHIVPLVTWLYEETGKNLDIKQRFPYDSGAFIEETPKPDGSPEDLLQKAGEMYKSLSSETSELFGVFENRGSFDVHSKKGKANRGFFSGIKKDNIPFIFANFNGTSKDVDILTHEFGHALAFDQSGKAGNISPLRENTMDVCEIHSMTMERLTYPHMNKFFAGKSGDYVFQHLASSLSFIPYGCMVDEFQHLLYDFPGMTPQMRNDAWLALEKKYRPHLCLEGLPYYQTGRFWQMQGHIFHSPFYFIDYCLADIVALQFDSLSDQNFKTAWTKYIALLKAGGTKTFLDMLEFIGMESPFKDQTISKVAHQCKLKITAGLSNYTQRGKNSTNAGDNTLSRT